MFNSGVPEKLIAENSGHKSTKALRCYEHTSSEQQKGVSKVIAKPGGVFQGSGSTTAEQQLSECSPKVELEALMVSSESKPITAAPALHHQHLHEVTMGLFLVLFSCFVDTIFD